MNKLEIKDEDWDRFLRLRQRLFKAIKESLEVDSHHKSYEGRFDIEVSLPNYFDEALERKPLWCLHLACYLIGPSRGEDWHGDSFHSVLKSAEKDLINWLDDHDDGWKHSKQERLNLSNNHTCHRSMKYAVIVYGEFHYETEDFDDAVEVYHRCLARDITDDVNRDTCLIRFEEIHLPRETTK